MLYEEIIIIRVMFALKDESWILIKRNMLIEFYVHTTIGPVCVN